MSTSSPATASTRLRRAIEPWAISAAVHGILALALVYLIQIAPLDPEIPTTTAEPAETVVMLAPAPAPLDAPPITAELTESLGTPLSDSMALAVAPGPAPGAVAAPGLSAASMTPPSLGSPDLLGSANPGAASFFGIAARSSKVAYVVDASGSSAADLPQILAELRNAISGLDPSQSFTVLIFASRGLVEAPPEGLKPADPATTARIRAWLTNDTAAIRPGGRSDPIPAFERALNLGVEEILFLSDGLAGSIGAEQILPRVAAANNGRAVIHTIHLRPQPEDEGPNSIMARIAAAHNGNYRIVQPDPEPLFP
ncbi:hypothetical protein [Mucisphaera sp.]|uniref:hypothetical protein n=1 Tax=Mucisphaera sp. TaxID=2913024 RepID=UPI003D0E5F19